jgi:hypothetical protein
MTFRELNFVRIEMIAKEGDSSVRRSELLEALAKRILCALQCKAVSTNVRVTGMELDVVGEDAHTGERMLIECKAYRDQTVAADAIFKLLGQVNFRGYSAGWLLCTSELGRDAKGVRDEYRTKPESERKKLRIYDPRDLIELLIATGQVIDPGKLTALTQKIQFSRNATLLISDVGEYWALTAVGQSSGVSDTVHVFNARSGMQVRDRIQVNALAERDSSLRALTWISNDDDDSEFAVLSDAALKRELDSIAPVPMADTWSDYRPARPRDFVGRQEQLRQILELLDDVRLRMSPTRLLAIKAPSGWGKSSFLNKLRATCGNVRNRARMYLHPVDCRTATSARYPELALKRCFDEALEDGFIPPELMPITVGSAGDPFSAPAMRPVLDYLLDENKVIVLFFDQFEEITSRADFSDLFRTFRSFCGAIDSAKENVVLGFSWKTDGVIPTDHPAYHMWHQFGDRRREFELSLFTAAEISQLLGGLRQELTHAIDPSLRRLLTEQCQGYPWLLKKLCIHVFGALRSSPTKQRELLERALDIAALFKKDLERLSSAELECVTRIARDSPADFYAIENTFGAEVISRLLDQRLIVRNAGKLILYWDIFREYVLTGRAPSIPSRYVPVTGPTSAKAVLCDLLLRHWMSLATLGRSCHFKKGTLDNIARDLVMMGVAQYNRKEQRVRLTVQSPSDVLARLFAYASTHVVYKRLHDRPTSSPPMFVNDVIAVLKENSAAEEYCEKTWRSSALRLLSWMRALGLVRWEHEDRVVLVQSPVVPRSFEQLVATRGAAGRRAGGNVIFKGDAPPQRVLEVLANLMKPAYRPSPEDRNSLYVLRSLGIIASTSEPSLIERPGKDIVAWLAARVVQMVTFRRARELLRDVPNASAAQVGQLIEVVRGTQLSSASKLRYGNGLLVWVRWVRELVDDRLTARSW